MEFLKDFLIPGQLVVVEVGDNDSIIALNNILGKDANISEDNLGDYTVSEIDLPSGRVLLLNPYNYTNGEFDADVEKLLVDDICRRAGKQKIPALMIITKDIIDKDRYAYLHAARYLEVEQCATVANMWKDRKGPAGVWYRLRKEPIHITVAGHTAAGKSSLIYKLADGMKEKKYPYTKRVDDGSYGFDPDWLSYLANRHGKIPLKILMREDTQAVPQTKVRDLFLVIHQRGAMTPSEIKSWVEHYLVPLIPSDLFDIELVGLLGDTVIPALPLPADEFHIFLVEQNLANPLNSVRQMAQNMKERHLQRNP